MIRIGLIILVNIVFWVQFLYFKFSLYKQKQFALSRKKEKNKNKEMEIWEKQKKRNNMRQIILVALLIFGLILYIILLVVSGHAKMGQSPKWEYCTTENDTQKTIDDFFEPSNNTPGMLEDTLEPVGEGVVDIIDEEKENPEMEENETEKNIQKENEIPIKEGGNSDSEEEKKITATEEKQEISEGKDTNIANSIKNERILSPEKNLLFFELIDESEEHFATFERYTVQIGAKYKDDIGIKKTVKPSEVSEEKQDAINECTRTINSFHGIPDDKLTLDELISKYEAYKKINELRPDANNAYMAWNTAEAVCHKLNNLNESYSLQLEWASKCIAALNEFILFEQTEVGEGEVKDIIERETILYRTGKIFLNLSENATKKFEQIHYSLIACAFFRNAIILQEAETSDTSLKLMSHYYFSLTVIKMKKHIDYDKLSEYEPLWQLAEESCKIAANLYNEYFLGNENDDTGLESNMEGKLMELKERFGINNI